MSAASARAVATDGSITNAELGPTDFYLTGDRAAAADSSIGRGEQLAAVVAVENFLGTDEAVYTFALFTRGEAGALHHVTDCPQDLLSRQYEQLPQQLGEDGPLTVDVLLTAIRVFAEIDAGAEN